MAWCRIEHVVVGFEQHRLSVQRSERLHVKGATMKTRYPEAEAIRQKTRLTDKEANDGSILDLYPEKIRRVHVTLGSLTPFRFVICLAGRAARATSLSLIDRLEFTDRGW